MNCVMPAARVLVVQYDDDLRTMVRVAIERAGMEAIEASDGRQALRCFYETEPGLIVLDIRMPELDGWQVLERVRELSDVPILILSASASELEKVRGLRAGADDYVTRPFGRQELIARIEALLRRAGDLKPSREMLADGLLEIDLPRRRVTALGREVGLTPTEFRLLTAFARSPDQVLSQSQLIAEVWGDPAARSPDQVKLYVGYVRRKLRDAAGVNPIETVRGFGYRYVPGPPRNSLIPDSYDIQPETPPATPK
jgi:DNA-binding response OmpR family regulator